MQSIGVLDAPDPAHIWYLSAPFDMTLVSVALIWVFIVPPALFICVDVVRQVQAARAALASMETLIIEDHVDTCVEQALTNGSIDDRRDKVNELVGILSGKKK